MLSVRSIFVTLSGYFRTVTASVAVMCSSTPTTITSRGVPIFGRWSYRGVVEIIARLDVNGITESTFSTHCASSSHWRRSLSLSRNDFPPSWCTPRACCTPPALSQIWLASTALDSPPLWFSTESPSWCTSDSRCSRRGQPSWGAGSCMSRRGEGSQPHWLGWSSPLDASRTAPSTQATGSGDVKSKLR